jgi:hypothetical protein
MDSGSDHALSLSRLSDDAMQRGYPDNFSSQEEWDAYNERLDAEERTAEHRALHGTDEVAVNYPETVVLRAADGCESCGGKGFVVESHGEEIDCDCCFYADLSPDETAAVEMGSYIIQPSDSYVRKMAERAEVEPEGGN